MYDKYYIIDTLYHLWLSSITQNRITRAKCPLALRNKIYKTQNTSINPWTWLTEEYKEYCQVWNGRLWDTLQRYYATCTCSSHWSFLDKTISINLKLIWRSSIPLKILSDKKKKNVFCQLKPICWPMILHLKQCGAHNTIK